MACGSVHTSSGCVHCAQLVADTLTPKIKIHSPRFQPSPFIQHLSQRSTGMKGGRRKYASGVPQASTILLSPTRSRYIRRGLVIGLGTGCTRHGEGVRSILSPGGRRGALAIGLRNGICSIVKSGRALVQQETVTI